MLCYLIMLLFLFSLWDFLEEREERVWAPPEEL